MWALPEAEIYFRSTIDAAEYFKSNYNRPTIAIVNVQLGPSPRLQMQNTSHAEPKLSNRCLDNCLFLFPLLVCSSSMKWCLAVSIQQLLHGQSLSFSSISLSSLRPKSIHCQSVRVCFANQIEICTRFVKVVTWICQRVCQSCYMDLLMLNWTDPVDHNKFWCLFPNNGEMCDDDTEVWTKLVGWVLIFNDWVHCAFGNVCLVSFPSERAFQRALHPSSSNIASLNSTSFICPLVLYLLRSTLFSAAAYSASLVYSSSFQLCSIAGRGLIHRFTSSSFLFVSIQRIFRLFKSVYSVLQWGNRNSWEGIRKRW